MMTSGRMVLSSRNSPTASVSILSDTTSTGVPAFPWKLHDILEDSERKGFTDIISWTMNGRAFKVHHQKDFEKLIMTKYCNQTQYKSFQRQLNIYGFRRVTTGDSKGAYTHDRLVRGKPDVCRFMVRTKIKRKGSKANIAIGNSGDKLREMASRSHALTNGLLSGRRWTAMSSTGTLNGAPSHVFKKFTSSNSSINGRAPLVPNESTTPIVQVRPSYALSNSAADSIALRNESTNIAQLKQQTPHHHHHSHHQMNQDDNTMGRHLSRTLRRRSGELFLEYSRDLFQEYHSRQQRQQQRLHGRQETRAGTGADYGGHGIMDINLDHIFDDDISESSTTSCDPVDPVALEEASLHCPGAGTILPSMADEIYRYMFC